MKKENVNEIKYWAKLLNERGFVTARSGNISMKLDDNTILMTSHDSYLGQLGNDELVIVDLDGNILEGTKGPTSEKSLHLGVYNSFPGSDVVVHSHSPFTTAYFYYFDNLDIFSFEAKFYLGIIPVVPQETPTVEKIEPVLKAFENSSLVVLKQHGVIAKAKTFKEAFSLIELLEEQCKVQLTVRASEIK